jgi:IS5 family transposase
VKSKGHDATLQKKPKGGELSIREKMRNKRISSKRAPVERPYAVIKTVFKSGHTRLTTVARNQVDNLMKCTAFNLIQLPRLLKEICSA